MAKRNCTSKKHPSSNRAVSAGSETADDNKEPHRRALHEAIEAERGKLSQAQSMLECLYLALENKDDSNPKNQVYYPDVVEMALEVVRGSVNRLDSIYLRPLVDAI
jgi:hypothetical protein